MVSKSLCALASGIVLHAVSAQAQLALEVVATGLARPLQVAAPEGDRDRIFVAGQMGQVIVVRNGQVLAQPFLDVTHSPTTPLLLYGERGLLGIAFHPDFDQNGHVFIYCVRGPGIRAVVERYTLSATDPDACDPNSMVEIWTTDMVFGNHNAGGIAFGPDGYLYVPVGDGGSTPPNWPSDPFDHAQRLDTMLGKVLRIDVDNPQPPRAYGIPPTNPFVGVAGALPEIWAYGLRNPWRCTFDRVTGEYYIADVGGRREEIDLEPPGGGGRNYGWPCMSGTFCDAASTSCVCSDPQLVPPLFEYDPPANQAVIGGYVYRGCAIPSLRGSYFFSDYMTGQTWTLQHNGSTVTQLVDRTAELVAPPPHTLTGIAGYGEDADGELYICSIAGEVYRIVPTTPQQAGISVYGAGTSGCGGPHVMSAGCSPVLGAASFDLRCTNGPSNVNGLIAFSTAADVAGSDPFGVGLTTHVQFGSSLLLLEPIASDVAGDGAFALPIPPSPSLVGAQLHTQVFWPWFSTICRPTPIGWSSSSGLTFTIQP
ncbi:MAG: PQQ-dependent sugar dehydrogenase [Planctomycetota bacterium]|nr:PQQ-dependent sugar dehydrogenase [Planctomycetota bacterium]MDA0934718.1 PQQ-dependent sugar dehydrogenase [Planctomycetota bacterium]MDA1221202.1 PQQ-dependent sugar dehydrogenase [Planctomycetota bacterium]